VVAVSLANVGRRILANTENLLRQLRELPGVRISSNTDPERRSGIVSFKHDTLSAAELHRELTQAGVSAVIRGGDSIRLSPHFYQGAHQVDAFAGLLERVIAQLR